MSSDFNFNLGFVVKEMFELGYTIKSQCFEGLYKTWTPSPKSGPPYGVSHSFACKR